MHSEDFYTELIEVMFGGAHVISEIFWNAVFIAVGFGVSKTRALKRIHKYVDSKHGVTHEDNNY